MLVMYIAGLCSCTQNDGRITPLFGSWMLDMITVDGEELEFEPAVWGFQSSLVCFQMILPMHETEEHWASWEREDDELTINFNNYDDNTPPGEWPYNPPRIPGFPRGASILHLKELKIESRSMKLENVSASDGKTYVYYLSKIY